MLGRNVTDRLIAYEQGELDGIETVELFADLIESGLAWQLQGHYGRAAARYIESGTITPDGKLTGRTIEA